MKVYDTLDKLAEEIKTSDEYFKYKEMKDMANENPELSKKLKEFEEARYATQVATIRGEEPEKEQIENMQKIYLELIKMENAREYLEAELEFNTMLSKVNEVLANVVKELM